MGPVGGDRSAWAYDSVDATAPPTNTIGLGGPHPSSASFTVVPGVAAPNPLPACNLSGQSCRTYVPASNGG